MMWFPTSGRTLVLLPALGMLFWICATLAWTPGEEKALRKVRDFYKKYREGLIQRQIIDDDHPNFPHPLEGPCVDHDDGCPVFAAHNACNDTDIMNICTLSCTKCTPLCIDVGHGCDIIKEARLCNEFYKPLCKKTCGVCKEVDATTESTVSPTTSSTTSTTTSSTTSTTTSPTTTTTTSPTTTTTTSPTTTTTTSPTTTTTTSPTTTTTTSSTTTTTTSPTTTTTLIPTTTTTTTSSTSPTTSTSTSPTTSTSTSTTTSATTTSTSTLSSPTSTSTSTTSTSTSPTTSTSTSTTTSATTSSTSTLSSPTSTSTSTTTSTSPSPITSTSTSTTTSATTSSTSTPTSTTTSTSTSPTSTSTTTSATTTSTTSATATSTTTTSTTSATVTSTTTSTTTSPGTSTTSTTSTTPDEDTKSLQGLYLFKKRVYTDDLADRDSKAFKDLKKKLEAQFASEYRRLLGDAFVDFIVKAFFPGSVKSSATLIVKEDTPSSKIYAATKKLKIPGGLVSNPEDIFKSDQECPQVCTTDVDPVCGSDGKTYSNDCNLSVASCLNPDDNIAFLYKGRCVSAECSHPSIKLENKCDFSSFPKNHTYKLKQKKGCAITKTVITAEEKAEILRVHNQFRAKVANGQETMGNPGGQPSGRNIRELTWSEELAVVATAWAKQCPLLKHDAYTSRRTCNYNVVGQNIYYTWTNKPNSVWTRAVGRWYSEVRNVPNTIVNEYAEQKKTIGHYTQILWGETSEIGCGAVSYKTTFKGLYFKHAKIYVCNYATAGNIIGLPIYEEGPAASRCGDGFEPSSCNAGLCSKIEELTDTESHRGFYRFKNKKYLDDFADSDSKVFKNLKKTLEDQFTSEYRRRALLGDQFVKFTVIAFYEGSVIVEGILVVKADTLMPDIHAATKKLKIKGGLDVSKPKDVFDPPSPPGCKFTAKIPETSSNCLYSKKFGDKHTANLEKNCACAVHKAGVTSAEKNEILTAHNNYRSIVAQGREVRGNPSPQPAGANIKELVWNDQLAEVAQAWANQCPSLRHDIYINRKTCQYNVVGQNIYYTWSNKTKSVWPHGISRWYNEVTKVPKKLVDRYAEYKDTIGHYTQMLWAVSTEIGCGAISYKTSFRGFYFDHAKIYVCNYGPAGNIIGRPIYLRGSAATKCNGDPSKKYKHLCKAMPKSDGTVPVTKKPPVTSGPVVTSEPGKCKFIAPTEEYKSGCDYTKYKGRHTANLKTNCSCEVHRTGLDKIQKTKILKYHNELRAKVARGEETQGKRGPQPPGANIQQLTWSDQLAELAQAWANQCPFLQHDTYSNRMTCDYPVVGQNIYYTWSNKDESVWERGISKWYSEVKDMTKNLVDIYDEGKGTIGHYTQMLWAETSQVGCGQVHYKTKFRGYDFKEAKIYVCNYGPAGNIIKKPVYERGAAATQCKDRASRTYPELCHVDPEPPQKSRSVTLWYVLKKMTYMPAYSDQSSKEFRDLKLDNEIKFTKEYKRTLGRGFIDFKILAFLPGSVVIQARLTVKKFVKNKLIEAATLALLIPGGLDLSNIKSIFSRPTQVVTTTETPKKCAFKVKVLKPKKGCKFDMFDSKHSVNLPVNCSCAVHRVGITHNDQELILKMHNEFRKKVAQGKEKRGNPGAQPPGANIKELIWSNELAQAAQGWANQCPFLRHDTYTNRKTCKFPVVGQNIYYAWSNSPDSVWARSINRWYNEVTKMPKLLVDFYAETKHTIGHYTQMLWANTAAIGCGAIHYKTSFRGHNFKEAKVYVCNYGPAGNILGKPIYKKGPAATQCQASKSKKYPYLCESTIMKPTASPTVKPDECDFTASVPEFSKVCNYKSYGASHTWNLPLNCQCKVHLAGVTNEEKQVILKTHNGYRALVANGDETRGNIGPQPAGSNIKELIWNDQLAEIAQNWANQCPFLQHDTYANRRTCNFPVVGQNIYYTWTNNHKSAWERAIGRWFNEVAKVSNVLVDSYADVKVTIGHYTQLLWAETAEIGCGAVVYKTRFRDHNFENAKIYVCNYGPAGNVVGKPIYQRGDPASACTKRPSKTYPGLCESTRVRPPTVAPPTSKPPGACKFTANVAKYKKKLCNYQKKFPPTHTIRLPKNCSCEVHTVGVSVSEKEEILKLHNDYRSQVARGQEKRGKPGPQFSGANIKQLKWNDQLAEVAQAWANQCPFLKHDTYINRKTCSHPVVGQNIYYTWSNRSDGVWTKGINRWYNEVENVPKSLVNSYAEHDYSIGHYTQMLWAKTTDIGCGAVVYKTNFRKHFFKNAKIYVCNYGPAGNILRQPVYKKGSAASKCSGDAVSKDYRGLCA